VCIVYATKIGWRSEDAAVESSRDTFHGADSHLLRDAALKIGCIDFASDRGSQFRSRKFVNALSVNGLRGSMGRVGACGDNAAMESFFALLQKNVLDRKRWATRDELRLAIVVWIEKTYHRTRRQRRLGRLTPIEFETINRPALAA